MSDSRARVDGAIAALSGGSQSRLGAALRDCLAGDLRIADFQRLAAQIDRVPTSAADSQALRVAILGGYTTQPIAALLPVVALADGRRVEIYEAPYDTFRQEILDPDSETYRFRPDLVLLATASFNLQRWPRAGASQAEIDRLLDETVAEWTVLWRPLTATGARVIQHSFDPPALDPMGRVAARERSSRHRFVAALNDRLWALDGRDMRLLDIARLAQRIGTHHWIDPRFYFHSKHGFAPLHAVQYARALGGLLRAMLATARKCLVLDLDNVLWGGVIGDDGIDRIALGPGSATGEAFEQFARYVKGLADRGVVLAACSRNDVAAPSAVFEQHPHMPLKLADFGAFVCNWEPKPDNIRAIARTLNLGLNSLVFVDDDPVECESVRRELPDVWVVSLDGDPAQFAARLDALHLFDSLDFTAEDAARSGSYQARAAIETDAGAYETREAFLASLDMRGLVGEAANGQLERVEQLFGKTNQFNLTGAKWNQSELAHTVNERVCLIGTLEDRFTRYGLVTAIVGAVEGDTLRIENWVVSCRVFSRTFEDFVLAELAGVAAARGCDRIAGAFRDSGRNGYARAWLARHGRLKPDGSWSVDVDDARAATTFVSHALSSAS